MAKIFHESQKERLSIEVQNLNKLQALVPHVPKLLAIDDKGITLIMSPVCNQFAATPLEYQNKQLAFSDHFCALVDILKQAHQNQLVHRDIQLSNFFTSTIDGKEVVVLNDWGCATQQGKETQFSGALHHAPQHFLKNNNREATYTPEFADDLEMVVKTFFQRIFCVDSMYLYGFLREKEAPLKKLHDAWEAYLSPYTWKKLMLTAQKGDYELLKKGIKALLVSKENKSGVEKIDEDLPPLDPNTPSTMKEVELTH